MLQWLGTALSARSVSSDVLRFVGKDVLIPGIAWRHVCQWADLEHMDLPTCPFANACQLPHTNPFASTDELPNPKRVRLPVPKRVRGNYGDVLSILAHLNCEDCDVACMRHVESMCVEQQPAHIYSYYS